MGIPQPKQRLTPLEYYALERDAAYKSDYYDGEIFAMGGGTSEHSLIATNILGELHARLKGKPCAAYESNLRLKIQATGLRTYPDLSVYCDPIQYDEEDPERTTALNPTIVFEVLSRTTERYDRVFKAQQYRQVKSLQAHVIVSQVEPRVEVYERHSKGRWLLAESQGLDASISLVPIEIELRLADVYDRVTFPPRASPMDE